MHYVVSAVIQIAPGNMHDEISAINSDSALPHALGGH